MKRVYWFQRWWIAFLKALGFYPKHLTSHQIAARKKRGEL